MEVVGKVVESSELLYSNSTKVTRNFLVAFWSVPTWRESRSNVLISINNLQSEPWHRAHRALMTLSNFTDAISSNSELEHARSVSAEAYDIWDLNVKMQGVLKGLQLAVLNLQKSGFFTLSPRSKEQKRK